MTVLLFPVHTLSVYRYVIYVSCRSYMIVTAHGTEGEERGREKSKTVFFGKLLKKKKKMMIEG